MEVQRTVKMKARITAIMVSVITVLAMMPFGSAVYANSTSNEITLGTAQLGYNCNSKNAAVVLWGGHDWRVIGYNGSGVASETGQMTLFASGGLRWDMRFGSTNAYADSNVRSEVDSIANNDLTVKEQNAVVKRTLLTGEFNYENTDCIAGEEVKDALLWPLSTKEAFQVDDSIKYVSGLYYWLRSPGNGDGRVANVAPTLINTGGGSITSGSMNVRPALNLDLESVLFISTENIKEYSGDWQWIGDVYRNTWTLTLLDSDHDSFAVDKNNIKYDGETRTATVPYSGALTGDNEYISAIVVDGDGEIGCYARVAEASSENDATITLNLRNAFYRENGDKVYVFNEQYSGDNKTDYASELIDITDRLYDPGLEGN